MKIKQIALAVILPLLMSCATFRIVRIDKNTREVRVETFVRTKDQLVFHLLRKIVLMECRDVLITAIVPGSHATALCTDEGYMFSKKRR